MLSYPSVFLRKLILKLFYKVNLNHDFGPFSIPPTKKYVIDFYKV